MRYRQSRINRIGIIPLIVFLIVFSSCSKNESAHEILNKTILSIDTIETIYYKQDMSRTNPMQTDDTIFRYREMYFKRLIQDSIVGVKGHWYFYDDLKMKVSYEDIYDGDRLIRKNNRDSSARIYDLLKHPEFKRNHFWSHNTLYAMQYTFKQMLIEEGSYTIERINDTIFMNKSCFQISILLENKTTMPGFAFKLEENDGRLIKTLFIIDKMTYYPLRMKEEYYFTDNPDQKAFFYQTYYDIKFNIDLDEDTLFNTSDANLEGYKADKLIPR